MLLYIFQVLQREQKSIFQDIVRLTAPYQMGICCLN